jgi:hypothetical protein
MSFGFGERREIFNPVISWFINFAARGIPHPRKSLGKMSTDPKSMFNKKSITDVDVKGKRVLMRVDFNVPMVLRRGPRLQILDFPRVHSFPPNGNTCTHRRPDLLSACLGMERVQLGQERG